MLRKTKFDDQPLINWKKFLHYINLCFGAIFFIVWTVILSTILKLILKFFILYIRGIYIIYKGISNFAKKNIKGFWLLLLIMISLIISILCIYKGYVYAQRIINERNSTQDILNKQQNINVDLLKENQKLKEDNAIKDKKLQAKADERAKFAQQQNILKRREMAEKKLPEEVKNLIIKYANTYGVKDISLINCIVFNESGGRDEAVGDSGKAIGVAQYHLATFLGHRKQMGLPQIDLRMDTNASIQAMMFSIGRGGIGNWSARLKCA